MSMPTMPRDDQCSAFSTMIAFCRSVNVRSIIRISPARTCGYSSPARSSPRIAARMMWSRSCSPPRFRFIGLKRSSSVVIRDAAWVADGDEAVELPEVLDRERDALLVREAPEDVGGDRAAEVGVQ